MEETTNRLSQKLGLAPGRTAITLYAPASYIQHVPYPKALAELKELANKVDWLQAFYSDKISLEREISVLKNYIVTSGQLWISWPKKSSGMISDLSDGIVRNVGLSSGLVDVKVVAVDDIWSALKFVHRSSTRV